MSKNICALVSFLLFSFLTVKGQKEAVIMGKIENATTLNFAVDYKLNPFTLEEASYEGSVDLNNLLGIKIKISEPRLIIFKYQSHKLPLFVVPDDTLKFIFDAYKIQESMIFEGGNAAAQKYLGQFSKRFTDCFNDTYWDYYRFKDKPLEFKNFIDTSYTAQKAFWDAYNPKEKALFTNAFRDFIQYDREYWRLFHLLNYAQYYKLSPQEPLKSYFTFLDSISVSHDKALNSVFYLRFLNLYLAFKHQQDPKTPLLPEAVQEKLSIVQVVRSRHKILPVIENPFNSPPIAIAAFTPDEEAVSQYLTTNEAVTFKLDSTKFYDYFLKVKLKDGRIGWLPQSFLQTSDKKVVERLVSPRLSFDEKDTLCGLTPYLEDKPLYFMALRELILGAATAPIGVVQQRTMTYLRKNQQYRDYNDILKSIYKAIEKDRENLIERLITLPDCSVEYFNLNKLFFDKNLSPEFGQSPKEEASMSLVPNPLSTNTPLTTVPAFMSYKAGKPNVFRGLVINDNVPPFKLKDINGNDIRQQDLLGKVVYMDFWATWCSPCQVEMTHSQALIERYKENKNIVFLYVSMDTDTDAWRQYLKTHKLQGIHTQDAENIPFNFMVDGLPNYFIIDKNGRVAYNSRISSKIDADSMIEFLLK